MTKATDPPGQVALVKRSKEVFVGHPKVSTDFNPKLQRSSGCFKGVSPSEGIKNALFQVPPSEQFQLLAVLEAEFRLDPQFRQRVVGLERMLRVREFLQATRACAVEHDSHDVVSECGSGKTALKHKESEIQGPDVSSGSCHPVPSCVADADAWLSRSCQRALPDGVGGGQPRVTKASESTGIIGSLVRHESRSSRLNSDNSSMGVACVESALPAVAPFASVFSSPCPFAARVAAAVHARRTVSPMHDVNAHSSWSDTVRLQGPTGTRRVKGGVSGLAEDLRPVSEVEAGCRFHSQEATRHKYQVCQGRCGHTFPPPGGSWYPIRVTWIRIGHQAINGLEPHGRGFGC